MSLRALGNSLPVNQELAPQSVAIRNDDVYLWIFAQDVSNPAYGMNQALFPFPFQLLPEITDIHFQHIALAAEVISPDAVKDHLTS